MRRAYRGLEARMDQQGFFRGGHEVAYITRADVLRVGDVVVYNFKQPAGFTRDKRHQVP